MNITEELLLPQKSNERRRNIDILDDIYHRAEKKTQLQLKSSQFFDEHGRYIKRKQKTIIEEQMEKIEEIVKDRFYSSKNFENQVNVTEVTDKTIVCEESRANYEKLKGRFNLKINHNLNMGKKIEMYANDNIAFYLHKNRNFIQKLNSHKKEKEMEKKMQEEKERDEIELQRIKDEQKLLLWMQKKQEQALNESQQQHPTTAGTDLEHLHSHHNHDNPINHTQNSEGDEYYEHHPNILSENEEDSIEHNNHDQDDENKERLMRDYCQTTQNRQPPNIQDHLTFNILNKNDRYDGGEQSKHQKAIGNFGTAGPTSKLGYRHKQVQSKLHQEPFYRSKTKKYESNERNMYRVNMLFNKILSQSLDNSTSAASRSQRGAGAAIASRGFNTTAKSFFTNQNLSNTQELPSLKQQPQRVEDFLNKFAETFRNKTTSMVSRQNQTNTSFQMPGQNLGAAIFMSEDQRRLEMQRNQQRQEMKYKVKTIIDRCLTSNKQTKNNMSHYHDQIAALHFKEQNFDAVVTTLRELENTDPSVIEALYQYKMTGQQEFDDEARVVTKEYKMGLLDPTREVSKYERQMRFKRRKDLLKGIIKIKAGK